jgi:hypothetical protein
LVFGTQRDQALSLLGTRIRIGRETKWIGNQLPGYANFLVGLWLVGFQEEKLCVSLYGEAEYVAAASCYAQLFWMRQTLEDYGIHCDKVPLLCDNESSIKIAYNRRVPWGNTHDRRSLPCPLYRVPAHGGGSIVFRDTSAMYYFAYMTETWFPVAEGWRNKQE